MINVTSSKIFIEIHVTENRKLHVLTFQCRSKVIIKVISLKKFGTDKNLLHVSHGTDVQTFNGQRASGKRANSF